MVFEDLRFFDLIDTTDNGTWNHVVVKQSFNSQKMQIIYPFHYTSYSLYVVVNVWTTSWLRKTDINISIEPMNGF